MTWTICKDAFPPLNKKKGAKVFLLSCGHTTDCVFGPFKSQSMKYWDLPDEDIPKVYSCNFCSEEEGFPLSYELINIPTINTYTCWSCEMEISDIPWNRKGNCLQCSNCGSLNKVSEEAKRNPIESRLRHECFKRDGYKCKECGKGKEQTTLHCDHILPVAQGGADELDNLQTLCAECNLAKSDRKWEANNGE